MAGSHKKTVDDNEKFYARFAYYGFLIPDKP